MVTFAPQNLISDPAFTRIDLLMCRNLLMYLEPAMQQRLISLFHYSLYPGGFLVLGTAETVGGARDLFAPLAGKTRLFRRLDSPTRPELYEPLGTMNRTPSMVAPSTPHPASKPPANLPSLTDRFLLTHYTPAALLVTGEGDILYISGKAGKYLEVAAGKVNWNVLAMAREGLRSRLNIAFSKAIRDQVEVSHKSVKVITDGGMLHVDVSVRPFSEPDALRGMALIVFKDVPASRARNSRKPADPSLQQDAPSAQWNQELDQLREELEITRKRMQTSQEELRASNEELRSTNEELQSTNEEVIASREEMQSMNEELQTLNHELQARVEELSSTSDDMRNLLDSTEIATLFLDTALCVRRFTPQTTRIIKLIPGDVGRPITDLVSDRDYPGLIEHVREVLRTLMSRETEVTSRSGHWFAVRIMPYRTSANRIEGVVITFSDISESKRLEAELRLANARLKERLQEESEQTAMPGEAKEDLQVNPGRSEPHP